MSDSYNYGRPLVTLDFDAASSPSSPRSADVAALREALEPFARMAVMDDTLHGLNPAQLRYHVAKAREVIARLEGGSASGIEAPSGVETGNTDSTEGESPPAGSGDAQ